jgi:uncharacterized protein with von Willebrand factor type A (vWA) domain
MTTPAPGPEAGRRLATAFAATCRAAGLEVPVASVVDYARALAAVGLGEQEPVYWAGRATLVHDPADLAPYDAAFAAFWRQRPAPSGPAVLPRRLDLVTDDGEDAASPGSAPAPSEEALVVRYSPVEVLRQKDFAACSPEELAEAQRLMARIRLAGATRPGRRMQPARRGRLDLRRTVRRSFGAGGEPLRRSWRKAGRRTRRVVILCDVSGSMEPYARALLRFVQAAVAGRSRVEAFALGTRLTRITRELSWRDPDAALDRAAGAVADWSGGTRLGEGLAAFNDGWGVQGMARGAVVVILSDGWDRGDPGRLGREMARLARVAHRVVWVNPLKATPGYAPLARGMAEALPHVDDFVEGHSLASLESLAEVIAA